MLRRGASVLPRLVARGGGAGTASLQPAADAAPSAAACRQQDVQQQQQQQQQRWQSALPQHSCASDDEHTSAATEWQEAERRRRLAEMARSSSRAASVSSRRQSGAEAWPSAQQVAERLHNGSRSGPCGSTPAPGSPSAPPQQGSSTAPATSSTLDWREVVEAVRRSGEDISGQQMLTDSFGRRHTYLRVSLTERCNLRCLYCMPEEGVDLTPGQELLSSEEVMRLARLFAAAGVDKIRLTGGEPTLRSDLVDLTRQLSGLPGVRAVGLTSNGLTLARKLPTLKAAGLSLLNVSLDTLQPERFVAMTRRQGHSRVLASIQQAVELGFDPVKVNVVVMRGVNEDEVPAFVELTRRQPINVRFIEYMPFDGNVWSGAKLAPFRDMLAAVEQRFGPLERCRDPAGEVAKNFRVPGFRGSVSFITSMTKTFCSDCNRLRILADGNLKVCLFGANEVSLRDAMREGASDSDLRAIISAAVDRKRAAHAGMFELAGAKNRAMVKIGG